MGIGPIDAEEANKIWKLIEEQKMDLYALMENYRRIKEGAVKPKLMDFVQSRIRWADTAFKPGFPMRDVLVINRLQIDYRSVRVHESMPCFVMYHKNCRNCFIQVDGPHIIGFFPRIAFSSSIPVCHHAGFSFLPCHGGMGITARNTRCQ